MSSAAGMTMSEAEPPGLVVCSDCRASVLPRNHCSVCGQPLLAAGAARRYAADPSEPAGAVRLVTTLFPRLPRADLDAFRAALGLGVLGVIALVASGYLPMALLASALLVPLLLAVYLYATDVYEDEPIRVIVMTLAWGALAGALYGLVLRELYPARIGPPADESLGTVIRVVLLPTVAMVLILVGPLALLRYRKFNDVLDGATFGAVSGAMFVGAQVIAQSIDLLTAGAQPGGDTWSWVLRILEHAIAIPLIAAGAAAGACGAFWLRYRAPVRDRAHLGLLGRPAWATFVACSYMVATSAALVLLRDLPRLLALAGLTIAALVWLRQLIHLGLRQEAVEAATSEAQECQDCRQSSPAGSFCVWCGVSLRALPKRAAGSTAETSPDSDVGATLGPSSGWLPRHDQPSRLSGIRSLGAFLVGWAVVLVAAAVLIIVLAPVVRPPCADPTQPCPALALNVPTAGGQGFGQSSGAVIRFGQTHVADGAGWQLDYDPRWWLLDTSDLSGAVWLTTRFVAPTVRGNVAEVPISLRLEVVSAADATEDQMLERLDSMAAETLESTSTRDEHGTRLLRPHVGFEDAVARYLVGDFGEVGSVTPFGAHLLAASDGRLTAGMILYVGQPDESFPFFSGSVRTTRYLGDLLDDVLKRFYWTEAGP
jgi:hypothetical protein